MKSYKRNPLRCHPEVTYWESGSHPLVYPCLLSMVSDDWGNVETFMKPMPLHTTRQAASMLGIMEYTLKHSRCTGILLGSPAIHYRKIGTTVRYDPYVIEDWIAQFEPRSNTAMRGG